MHGKTTGDYRNKGTGQGIRIIFNFQRAKVQLIGMADVAAFQGQNTGGSGETEARKGETVSSVAY
jgi:hypothetical protein